VVAMRTPVGGVLAVGDVEPAAQAGLHRLLRRSDPGLGVLGGRVDVLKAAHQTCQSGRQPPCGPALSVLTHTVTSAGPSVASGRGYLMWTWLLGILATACIVAALIILLTGRTIGGMVDFQFGDKHAKGSEVGILFVAAILMFLGAWFVSPDAKDVEAGTPIPTPERTLAAAVSPMPSSSVTSSASAPTSMADVAGEGGRTSTGAPYPSGTTAGTAPEPIASTPPWSGNEQGLRLIVEDAAISESTPDRYVLTVRLENATRSDLLVTAPNFLTIDQNERSYGVDAANSTFPFDDFSRSYWSDLPFAAGTTRTGTVMLERPLEGATELFVRFTVARYESADYKYFTVATSMKVPGATVQEAVS
jgi:hypothetical protein